MISFKLNFISFFSTFVLSFFILLLSSSIHCEKAEQWKALEEWYHQKNPTFRKLSFGVELDKDQLKPGVFASEALKKGEQIIIPRKHLISQKEFLGTDIGDILHLVQLQFGRDLLYDPADYFSLALIVWYEKYVNQDSEWKLWFDSLPEPSQLNNILFFTTEEMQEIKGTPLWERAVARREEVLEAFKWMQVNLFGSYERAFPRIPTLQEFRWAVSIVRTRNVHSNRFRAPILTPIFDLFRHVPFSNDQPVTWELTEDDRIILHIHQDIEAGSEIKITLGEIYDCVNLYPQIPEDDPLIDVKSVIFKRLNAGPNEVKITEKGITTHLLLINRILSIYDSSALGSYEAMYGIDPDFDDWPLEVDILAYEEVVKQCKEIYNKYPTTLEEDEEILLDEHLSYRKRASVQMRIGEKKILHKIGSYYFQKMKEMAEKLKKESSTNKHDEL